jgi:hypothetical protein
LATLLLMAAACGDSESGPQVVAPSPALDVVTVSDPGTGDLTQLRWQPGVGDTATFEIVIGLDTVVEIDELKQEAQIGPATMVFDAVVSDVGSEDEITTEYTVTSAGVPDGSDPNLDAAMARMVGSEVTQTVSATGLPMSLDVVPAVALGAAEEAQLDRFVRQLSSVFTPLPTEAVGAGATWSYAALGTIQGVTWLRTLTYQLADDPGAALILDVEIADFAEFQEVDAAGPTNLEGTIEGTGRNAADLLALSPRDFESATRLEAPIFTGDKRTGRTANRTETTLTSVDSGS